MFSHVADLSSQRRWTLSGHTHTGHRQDAALLLAGRQIFKYSLDYQYCLKIDFRAFAAREMANGGGYVIMGLVAGVGRRFPSVALLERRGGDKNVHNRVHQCDKFLYCDIRPWLYHRSKS